MSPYEAALIQALRDVRRDVSNGYYLRTNVVAMLVVMRGLHFHLLTENA